MIAGHSAILIGSDNPPTRAFKMEEERLRMHCPNPIVALGLRTELEWT